VASDLTPVAALGGVAGGVFPDLNLLAGVHRKTLHFPDYYWVGAVPVLAATVVAPGPAVVAVAYFFLSAAVHSVTDIFGAGTEPRPLERTSDEAVYVHSRDRWVDPRYRVRYDGAPEDGLLTVRRVTVVFRVVGGCYTLVRKHLPRVEERLF
jgi:hypothetical protein